MYPTGPVASGITQYVKRPSQVMRATLVGMRPPSHNRTIAMIDHRVAVSARSAVSPAARNAAGAFS